MRRKRIAAPDSLVPSEVLQHAKEPFEAEPRKRTGKCAVCGGECSPISAEQLCWVCRRLKISAWQDSDQQMPAQE